MIDAQLRFNQCNSFREEYIHKIYVFYSDMKFKMAATAGLSLTLDPMGKMFQNASSLMIIPGQFDFNCQSGFREEAF
jgi:hypothetical protein